MNTLFQIIMAVAMISLLLKLFFPRHRGKVHFANIGEGTREGGVDSLLFDAGGAAANAAALAAALAANVTNGGRFLLYKKTTDADHITVCGAGDVSIGICQDAYDANNTDQPVAVKIHGVAGGLQRMVTDGTITDGVPVKCGATGFATAATTGDAGIFGRAYLRSDMTSAAGDVILVATDITNKMAF